MTVCAIIVAMDSAHFFTKTADEIEQWCRHMALPAYRASQLIEWVYAKRVFDPMQMTNLGKGLRQTVSESFAFSGLTEVEQERSKDGETVKFLWELGAGEYVESVLIYGDDRRTLCVSSQVGCNARCSFCASGKKGLKRNLTAGEIVEQVLRISQVEPLTHLVFMGMGEPLDNYEAVVRALKILTHPAMGGFSKRRITVSTVGIPDKITALAEEDLGVNLVLSLHAPTQAIRKKIIPYARKYPLENVLEAMRHYSETTKRDITYEYILLHGLNDAPEHAEALATLLERHQCSVNLIPYNPVEGLRFTRPDKTDIWRFKEILAARGLIATQRYTKGKDIAAACGQLALKDSRKKDLKSSEKAV